MSTKIEAKTIDEAYQKAVKEFNCSIVELDITIVQNPSAGLLGLFRKNAVISVSKKGEKPLENSEETVKTKNISKKAPVCTVNNEVIQKIEDGVKKLLNASCYDIELKKIEKYNDNTVCIYVDGEDAALLIGKEGYRYKAFSYLLYNWANIKYDVNVRLEIAEFLSNQKEMIKKYLEHVIEKIKNNGRAQTKVLDGILVKIALEELRAEFPDKYVGIRTARNGGKYVLVNDFNRDKNRD
jgi:spoIIIJ-associated protein